MSRLYYFSPEKKEVGYASYFGDFLSDKDVYSIFIFRTKREILYELKERFKNAEITAEEFKKLKKEIKNF